jgi:hypothetical protein
MGSFLEVEPPTIQVQSRFAFVESEQRLFSRRTLEPRVTIITQAHAHFCESYRSKTSLVDTGGKTVQVDLWELQPSAGVLDETRFEPSPTLDDLKVDEAIAKQWAASDLEVEGQASEIPEPKSKRKVSKEGQKEEEEKERQIEEEEKAEIKLTKV